MIHVCAVNATRTGRKSSMNITQALCEQLEKKKELFLIYEENTAALTQCAAEDIEHYITKRTELAIDIDKVNEKIEEICEKQPQSGRLRDAAANRCEFDTLPQELHCVFETGQEVLGVMNRIAGYEPAALARMQALLAEYREGIASTQNAPKIARYISGTQTAEKINLLDGRDKA